MTSQEKQQIYTLLKTASDCLCQYKDPSFPQNPPLFTDDKQIIKEVKETTEEFHQANVQQNISLQTATENKNGIPQNLPPVEENSSIQNIAKKISECVRCPLCKTRHNTVPGMGVSSPYVLVIGEGPGYEEDMQGLPFVGPAGQLLDKMLAAIKLSRKTNTYIANIVKCRPPMNRNPYPEEADACSSFLQAQIAILKPKAILCVGTVAAKNLLHTELGVTKLRGNFYEYCKIPVGVTYHPSALLRDEQLKRPAWEDLKLFRTKLLALCPDYETHF